MGGNQEVEELIASAASHEMLLQGSGTVSDPKEEFGD